ncbi:DUF262 domain-containing HNH endonuclease family protein [Salicola sp. Rm-C-2C1-2]|uniref:DUF262 domain-containing protein n=1 Tax=Salicola sp. Rm-C-2C1-2 TaxID=3141321 RepID=UPI0032E402E4
MNEQSIQSQDIKLADVFQAFYTVPDYQREYVWETDQVEQLLSDINSELAGNEPTSAPEYFIGSIVVCPGGDGVLELIDGQQRMTSLFITLCAIRDRMREIGEAPPGALGYQIAATSTDASGCDHFRYRLDLQYEDSGDILVKIAEGCTEQADATRTRSIANILNAYQVTLAFLKAEFGVDTGALRAFYGYLSNKVKLIRIQTKDVAKALKIFETINDRGVGLDSMDLLKNLLFMKASRDEFENLKSQWKELQDTIFEMGEKPLRFLRYFIFSRYDVEALREDEIYGWFSRNESACGYANDPLGFAKELLRSAEAYKNFLNGRDQYGEKNRHLENLQVLGGKAARQHLILLLAGRHLQTEHFDQLAREVENLFFVFVITREPTREFERNFAQWAIEVRKISDESDLNHFIARRFVPAKSELSDRFEDSIRRLHMGAVQQYRLRYILAKLTQHIDMRAYGVTEGTKWLTRYTGGGFEIEHIYPQQPSQKAEDEFGAFEDVYIAERLGNLVLVEKSINASLGNRPYSQKRDIYRQSQLLLTKALVERPKVGANTKIDIAVSELDPFVEWNEAAVLDRQDKLTLLARDVWELPIGDYVDP